MTTQLIAQPIWRLYDNSGALAVGGQIYTYQAGTTTPQPTYQDQSGVSPNTNPIITNSRGEWQMWMTPGLSYKVVAKDAAGNVLWTVDNVVSTDLAGQLAAAAGAMQVGVSQGSTYTAGTVGARLAQDISVMDLKYMTLAQIVDVVSYTGSMDVTACIQAALNDIANTAWLGTSGTGSYAKGGGKVYLPPGKWRITDTLKVGNNTELYGASPQGGTAVSITTNTGTLISCDFSANQKRWAISSATYESPAGTFAAFNRQFSGTDHDTGAMTLCFGIKIHNLTINGNGAYGGVRLMGGAGFDVRDVFCYQVGVGYLFNTSYGASYGNLRAFYSLYGMVQQACTAIEGGHFYGDKVYTTWSNVAADPTTRLVSVTDMNTGAFLPADWTNKNYGLYCANSINIVYSGPHVCEHTDIGMAFAHVSDLLLTGYCENNGDSDYTFVATTGQVTAFANATTSGFKYHFGTLNNVTLESCSVGGIYVGETISNKIRVQGIDTIGSGVTDWTWSDVIDFQDLGNVLRVSATGSTSAVLGYTTLDEALRRISVSRDDKRSWVIKIKDGDTVATANQRSFTNKDLIIEREGGGTKPVLSVAPSGGGFIFRWSLDGACRISVLNVDLTFPAIAAAAVDNALINAGGATDITFTAENSIINLNNAYSLFGTFANCAMNLGASWATCGITASTPAAILRNSGSALICSIQANTTLLAGIKALGTNGWQGTVLSSNFV